MIYTPKDMTPGSALTAVAATYYTAPSGATDLKAIVKEIILCNTDTVARTATIYVVPSGGSAAAANTIVNSLTVLPNETRIFGLSKVMSPGGFIQALASSAGVISMAVSGIEVTV